MPCFLCPLWFLFNHSGHGDTQRKHKILH
ncbi:MAG: DUF2933 domain-containing protein [Chitinophagaceae bacterium]|nr:DUF2933 domain-containing protein [Chitinophagaceae bacterium]MBK9568886.1 DUF2933 domain-containing protein [Chitinophagaceae bacterium]MBL0131832.1 DUF2933 domain-containing protein [Chitinophagaceae bacterium]MBL0272993.1 DUF2933 domain-containing protein [Chitinophagaceae bacterium]